MRSQESAGSAEALVCDIADSATLASSIERVAVNHSAQFEECPLVRTITLFVIAGRHLSYRWIQLAPVP